MLPGARLMEKSVGDDDEMMTSRRVNDIVIINVIMSA